MGPFEADQNAFALVKEAAELIASFGLKAVGWKTRALRNGRS